MLACHGRVPWSTWKIWMLWLVQVWIGNKVTLTPPAILGLAFPGISDGFLQSPHCSTICQKTFRLGEGVPKEFERQRRHWRFWNLLWIIIGHCSHTSVRFQSNKFHPAAVLNILLHWHSAEKVWLPKKKSKISAHLFGSSHRTRKHNIFTVFAFVIVFPEAWLVAFFDAGFRPRACVWERDIFRCLSAKKNWVQFGIPSSSSVIHIGQEPLRCLTWSTKSTVAFPSYPSILQDSNCWFYQRWRPYEYIRTWMLSHDIAMNTINMAIWIRLKREYSHMKMSIWIQPYLAVFI